ncbi:hypothetical protein MPLDJ20_20076 [Mesorhizobium plurifarium]|uniref:Uncharacterized protein n=1 Tax=Mesorhizobium plurifarium TaxID=69974 RepID=A0A090EU38_MESPL|nr:hypothetical protein MPLDJ20_20076 [Mesorhizobium plurifarium]
MNAFYPINRFYKFDQRHKCAMKSIMRSNAVAKPIEARPAANTASGSSGDDLILDFSKVMLGSTAVLARTPSRPAGAPTEPSAARTKTKSSAESA